MLYSPFFHTLIGRFIESKDIALFFQNLCCKKVGNVKRNDRSRLPVHSPEPDLYAIGKIDPISAYRKMLFFPFPESCYRCFRIIKSLVKGIHNKE